MNEEIWKPIKGYEEKYAISSYGRVKTVDHIVLRKNDTTTHIKERIRKPWKDNQGYLNVAFWKDGEAKIYSIAVMVAEHWGKNKPSNEHQINHNDGNKANNIPENVDWVTASANIIHAYDNELAKKKRAVNEEIILKIIDLRNNGNSYAKIENKLQLPRNVVNKMYCGRFYRALLNKMKLGIDKSQKPYKIITIKNGK